MIFVVFCCDIFCHATGRMTLYEALMAEALLHAIDPTIGWTLPPLHCGHNVINACTYPTLC